jgi:hypothetical protein
MTKRVDDISINCLQGLKGIHRPDNSVRHPRQVASQDFLLLRRKGKTQFANYLMK